MDLEYVSHEDLDVPMEHINDVIDIWNTCPLLDREELSDEEYEVEAKTCPCDKHQHLRWWGEHNFPEGMQLIELHLHMSLRAYITKLFEERGMADNNPSLRIRTALTIDSMIH